MVIFLAILTALFFPGLIGLNFLEDFLKITPADLMGASLFFGHHQIQQAVQLINFHAPPSADIFLYSFFANLMPIVYPFDWSMENSGDQAIAGSRILLIRSGKKLNSC